MELASKKSVLRKAPGLPLWETAGGAGFDRQHICLQFQHHAALIGQIMPAGGHKRHLRRKPRVEINAAVLVGQHAGIEGKRLAAFCPQICPSAKRTCP